MRMTKRVIQALVIVLILNMALTGVFGAIVKFESDKMYGDEQFIVTLEISNAKFNAFQFALRYDNSVISPVDSRGSITSKFEDFALKGDSLSWLSVTGAGIDKDKGLIDFTGFVSPGSSFSTDGLSDIKGYANIGDSGIKIFSFHFKRIGKGKVEIEIAKQGDGKPFSKYFPEGAGILAGGDELEADIRFNILSYPDAQQPSTGGGGGGPSSPSSISPPEPDENRLAQEVRKRIDEILVLQIANPGASSEGKLIPIDEENNDVTAFIDNGRTMVPIRFIAESLGALVGWDGKSRTVTIEVGDKKIVMMIGSKQYTINGEKRTMDTAPVIVQGWSRTMVPIRFVAEALGKAVEWDSVNRLVLITPAETPWEFEGQTDKDAMEEILQMMSSENM